MKPLPPTKEKKPKTKGEETIFIDKSSLKMQEKEKAMTIYMRALANGNYQLYDFRENRCRENAFEILKDYSGVVHSHKYGPYEILVKKQKIIWSSFFSHIRRKFFESETDSPFRDWVLRKIHYQTLFLP